MSQTSDPKRVTIVFEAPTPFNPATFWAAVTRETDLRKVGGQMGDLLHLNQMYAQYGRWMRAGIPSFNTDPDQLRDTTGETFWKFADGMYANHPDLFSAQKVYPDRISLEIKEGACREVILSEGGS